MSCEAWNDGEFYPGFDDEGDPATLEPVALEAA